MLAKYRRISFRLVIALTTAQNGHDRRHHTLQLTLSFTMSHRTGGVPRRPLLNGLFENSPPASSPSPPPLSMSQSQAQAQAQAQSPSPQVQHRVSSSPSPPTGLRQQPQVQAQQPGGTTQAPPGRAPTPQGRTNPPARSDAADSESDEDSHSHSHSSRSESGSSSRSRSGSGSGSGSRSRSGSGSGSEERNRGANDSSSSDEDGGNDARVVQPKVTTATATCITASPVVPAVSHSPVNNVPAGTHTPPINAAESNARIAPTTSSSVQGNDQSGKGVEAAGLSSSREADDDSDNNSDDDSDDDEGEKDEESDDKGQGEEDDDEDEEEEDEESDPEVLRDQVHSLRLAMKQLMQKSRDLLKVTEQEKRQLEDEHAAEIAELQNQIMVEKVINHKLHQENVAKIQAISEAVRQSEESFKERLKAAEGESLVESMATIKVSTRRGKVNSITVVSNQEEEDEDNVVSEKELKCRAKYNYSNNPYQLASEEQKHREDLLEQKKQKEEAIHQVEQIAQFHTSTLNKLEVTQKELNQDKSIINEQRAEVERLQVQIKNLEAQLNSRSKTKKPSWGQLHQTRKSAISPVVLAQSMLTPTQSPTTAANTTPTSPPISSPLSPASYFPTQQQPDMNPVTPNSTSTASSSAASTFTPAPTAQATTPTSAAQPAITPNTAPTPTTPLNPSVSPSSAPPSPQQRAAEMRKAALSMSSRLRNTQRVTGSGGASALTSGSTPTSSSL
ncbi:hypothetical protein Pelo_12030 [Pelomyxa schiedti]|nr:hypothetical protein Pelo_12030 [Pelomyxa schiedti]